MHSLVSGLTPMHPGELLREDILPALNRSKAEIARLIEVSRQTLYDILAERQGITCLLYTSPSPRDGLLSRMPSSA